MDKLILLFLGLVCCAHAHMSIFVPSMWGSEPWNINSNWAVQPLQNYKFEDWWMHGNRSLSDPPPANNVTVLPAGGVLDFEITGNKAFTSMGRGLWVKPGATPRMVPDPWSNDMGGGSSNIHAQTHDAVAGCAIAIAYKSNVMDVKPTDFIVVSAVHDCIARQLQAFDFPALPACPNNKCVCAWFWIHNSTGGTDQMYMTPFQCTVGNPSKRVIGTPVPPYRCDGQPMCYLYPKLGNISTTCPKVLNPMYFANDDTNMANPPGAQCAPIYHSFYGFVDGAQNQIFVDNLQPPAGSIGDTLYSPSSIQSSSSSLLVSPGFYSKLAVQADGNVVLSDVASGKVYWSTNTANKGTAPFSLTIGSDGNLVLSDAHSATLWSSNTANQKLAFGPYRLKLRDTPVSLTVVDSNSSPIWSAPVSL